MSSCEFFQIEKYTSDYLLEEEIQAMNWEEVDVYPIFKGCEDLEQTDHVSCFVSSLHSKVSNGVQRYAQLHALDSLTEINIQITVAKERELSFSVDNAASLFKTASNLEAFTAYLQEGLDSLQVLEPAFKRGVPVTTVFALPIIFSQENE